MTTAQRGIKKLGAAKETEQTASICRRVLLLRRKCPSFRNFYRKTFFQTAAMTLWLKAYILQPNVTRWVKDVKETPCALKGQHIHSHK